MNKKKALLFVAGSALLFGGCDVKSVPSLYDAVINVVKNSNIVPDQELNKFSLTCYDICQDDDKNTLNIYGRLSNMRNSYNSYLKLSYDNIDFSNYNFSNRTDSYKSLQDVVNNYPCYKIENVEVDKFFSFESIFNAKISKTHVTQYHDFYRLTNYEVLNIEDFRYNEKTSQLEFSSSVIAHYIPDGLFIIGPYVYNKEINHTFDVKYNIPQDVYANCNNDSKKIINVLEDYVKNGHTDEYTITESEKPFTYKQNKSNAEENTQKTETEGMIF